MGPSHARQGRATAKKKFNRKYNLATKHRTKDIDQIREDLAKKGITEPGQAPPPDAGPPAKFDEDLPGGGRFYCPETARHFVSQDALDDHRKSKIYKIQIKRLKAQAYDQSDAEFGAGITKEVLPSARAKRLKMETEE